MHQAAWLAWAAAGGLAAAATTNPFYLVLVVAAAWVVHAAHRDPGPRGRAFRIFLTFGGLALVTRTVLVLFSGRITTGVVATAILEGGRLATLLVVFGAFNSVSDPFRLLKLAPRRFHEPALAAALAVSIAPRTIAAAARVREAQRSRGIEIARWRGLPALAVPVLETGMEEALTLAESMDARGHGRGPRTRYRPDRWDRASLLIAAGAAICGTAFVGALAGGDETLAVPTFPLQWPNVSWLLVGALLALAAPAFARPRP